jgi:hypothetical protein
LLSPSVALSGQGGVVQRLPMMKVLYPE